jgi:hypothetical protein
MLRRLWERYLKIWPALVESRVRFYSIAIGLGAVMVGGVVLRSWVGVGAAWVGLIGIILLALPMYYLPWNDDE